MNAHLRQRSKASVVASLVMGCLLFASPDAFAQKAPKTQKVPNSFNVVPINITQVVYDGTQLVAHGLVGTNPFTSVLTLTPRPGTNAGASQNQAACPILDLELGPIDLTLLGLRVETSPICLQVTAYDGGGLLGDLLCEVANLLQGGTPLSQIVALLQARGQLDDLLAGLTSLLNGALDAVTEITNPLQSTQAVAATCSVLSLALGPIELNLLGLEVILDDCNNGPVTVDITAIPGGGLLGDLLCSLSDVLGGPNPALVGVRTLLWQITRVIGGLIG